MELALKFMAGTTVAALVAMVLVVWLVCRRPAAPSAIVQPRMPAAPIEKPVAFYQGPKGVMPGEAAKK